MKFHDYYDEIYSLKDYKKEVDVVYSIISPLKPANILDIGCGTGNHTAEFAKRDGVFRVVGVDNDKDMIERAKQKFINAEFYSEPVSSEGFSLAVSLFNVVNYIQDINSLKSFFGDVRYVTNDYYIFDCWNGVAALFDPPKKTTKIIKNIVIDIEPEIDYMNQVVHMKNKINVAGDVFDYEYDQKLWTPAELKYILQSIGFNDIQMFDWMKPGVPATVKSWKIMVVCK
jgi:SAM-dependent methyltransferase